MLVQHRTMESCAPVFRGRSACRFLLYSHDGLGLGHTRRHVAIARALTELAPGSSVLLATGSDIVNRLGLTPAIDILKLPSLRKVSNEEYAARRLQIPASEMRSIRSALLHSVVKEYRPTVVLVDKHPFGVNDEFCAGLEELRAGGGCAVLGLRDILDERKQVLKEWSACRMRERIAAFHDLVLVYGEPSVFDPVREYEFPEALANRTRFAGYIVNPDDNQPASGAGAGTGLFERARRPKVLATAGGGEDGFLLLKTFIRAAAGASWDGIAVAGPMSPGADFKTLKSLAARAGVTLHTFVTGLPGMFRSLDALVCMGGYNTLVEAVSKGVPTVCVPRTFPRREQLIRARAFERLGLLTVIEPEQLDVRGLDRAIQSVIGHPRRRLLKRAHSVLTFDGARQAARQLLALASPVTTATHVATNELAL